MKFKLFLLSALIAWLAMGCQPGSNQKGLSAGNSTIAGVWHNTEQRSPWKFVLEKDGTISEVFRPDGLHMILAEGGLKQEPAPNLFASYIYGPCTWSYHKATKIMKVKVVIDNFYVKANDSELSCQVIDEFEGPLSNKGVWTATWKTITKLDPPALDQTADGGTLTFVKE